MSFRSRVLDALDIKKDHVRIPVYQTFLNPSESNPAVTTTANDEVVAGLKPYAVSRCINDQVIGPKSRTERLEVLGFVVGDDPGAKVTGEPAHLPDALNRDATAVGQDYSGIHYLGGLYDSTNRKLMKMRKSAITPPELDTLYQPGAGTSGVSAVNDHTHKDWPNTATEQAVLLNDSPAADALYYHKTQVRFLLTGIDDVSASGFDQASNHRGTVRMLVLRPRVPAVRTRVDGTTGDFKLNYDYLPDWHTELFYDRSKQLGGKLDPDSYPHTSHSTSTHTHGVTVPGGSSLSPHHEAPYPAANSLHSSHIVTYGITKAAKPDPEVELDTNNPHYGHMKVTVGKDHQLTPTDLLMSKINKQKYAVLHDEVFTLDSLHHGAAAQHIAQVNIPYNKKVKFAGRQPLVLTNDTTNVETVQEQLSNHTFDTPMNMASRPIILFLSYNQKISASVEGWTAISEC